MKKSLVLAGLLLVSSSAMAVDAQWFVGIGAERVNSDVTATAGVFSASADASDTSVKIAAGTVINKNHRVSLSYAKFDDNGGTIKTTLLNYDYLITSGSKFTPYVGLHYGIADAEIVDGTFSADDKGSAYGAQVGALYSITDNIEFEANIAYTGYSVDSPIKNNGVAIANTKYELDKTTSFYVGFNYKF